MDITDYTKAKAEFLKAEDIIQNPAAVFLITDHGNMVENKFGNERLHLGGEFNGQCKTFDLSSTNARILVSLHGAETSQWLGKSITLDTYTTRTSDAKMVNAIAVSELQ